MISELKSWMRAMTQRGRLEAEMETELAEHVAHRTEDLMRAGMTRDDAARQARVELGPMLMHKEEMRTSLGLKWFDELASDLRYALRLLRKSPGFTLIAAGSLALAIGANSTIFAVGRQLLFGRVTVPHPEELRNLNWLGGKHTPGFGMWGEWSPAPEGGTIAPIFSYPMYQQLKAENHEIGDLVAFKGDSMNATVHGDAQRADVVLVSGNFYEQMQVRVQLGRPLEPADDVKEGAGTVVVISDGLWTRKYGRSPAVLGQIVRVNQQLMTIVGVNPRGFTGIKGAMDSPDLFVPITMLPVIDPKNWGKQPVMTDPNMLWVNIAARTKPGIKDDAAQATLGAKYESALRGTVKLKDGETLPKLVLADGSRGLHMMDEEIEKPIYVLFGFTVLLLLLACVNVANLLLARGAQRQREINVRMAMGARRGRIVRQLFTESLLLAGLGGVGGLMLSIAGRNLLPRLMENPWETDTAQIPFDWLAFGFTLLVTFATATIFGLLPAWLAARNEVSSQLKESGHQATRRRKAWSGKGIVALQIALSTVLVIGAGVFLRTVLQLNSVDLGFDPNHVLMFDVQPPAKKYADGRDVLLHKQLEQKIAAVPGAESVSPAWMPLASGNMMNSDFVTEDKPADGKNPPEFLNAVGNDYFHTMRIPMITGRAFGPQDTSSSVKVAVINQALSKKRFPNGNPIGKRFRTDDPPKGEWIQVVGICADTRYAQLKDEPPPVFYLPYVQQKEVGGMTYQIRTHTSAAALAPSIQRIVQGLDPDLPMIDIRTEREQIDATMQMERTLATLTTGFGLMALILASVGIYGIMAYTVSQRTNEIGIRLALGAERGQIRGMILGESTWITATGLVAGVAGALGLVRLVKSMLFGIAPYDPVTLGCAVTVMLGVAVMASWIPAGRAAGVEPMEALRHE
ncbi:ABC transporter permease [Terracidiphilus gabretensis]|uniref:ABC transporter permease n=1 Tax=Terracidiphilus gabretensis TaxID=1577687 RepID=UPI00071BAE7E|nr:ABC transporter permease [Terracidiphilus gabretensis]